MGFLDRLRGRGDDDPGTLAEDAEHAGGAGDAGTAGSGAVEGVEPLEEIGVRRLSPDEEAVLDEARAGYAAHVHGVERTLWLVDTDAAVDLEP